MNSVVVGFFLCLGTAFAVPPALLAGRLGGVAVVPAGLTVAAQALAAQQQQLAYQLAQARGAAIQDALNLAQAGQSLGNQYQNSAVRDSIAQRNAERVQSLNNLAQASRNALAQAQAAQIQISQSNSASSRNAAIQALQGNNAAAIQYNSVLNELAFANAYGASPILLSGEPLIAPALGPLVAGPAVAIGRAPLASAAGEASGSRGATGSRGSENRDSRRGSEDRRSKGSSGSRAVVEDSEAVPGKHPAPTSSKLSSSHLSTSAGVGWGRKN